MDSGQYGNRRLGYALGIVLGVCCVLPAAASGAEADELLEQAKALRAKQVE